MFGNSVSLPRLGALRWFVPLLAACFVFPSTPCSGQQAKNPAAPVAESEQSEPNAKAMLDKAVEFLRDKGQAADGSFSKETGPAVTAIVTAGLLRNGLPTHEPVVKKGLEHLLTFVQPDGGIYKVESNWKNYETCLALLCLTEANKDGELTETIKKAEAYVKKLQWNEEEGHGPDSLYYGGAGYGGKSRPDLSNTAFLVDALVACGNGPDDPHLQAALKFISNCQNLENEKNQAPFASKNSDGGFYYTCAAGGASMAGETPEGGLRSYASMTYAGLKSMIYCGVDKDDPRMKAAQAWIQAHYALNENPGMGTAGLYYYYQTFAKALAAAGESELTLASGEKKAWKQELLAALAQRQKTDGSWTNENNRWMESDPNLVTGYALLALSFCRE